MNRKRREDSFFGLHFDFHATPETLTGPVGGRLTEEMLREICQTIHPDFIQIDCKGHPGWASYPSKLGNGVTPMRGDPLKLWRRITDEYGIALYMHYSGVIDERYVEAHPEEARVTEEGKPDERVTSVFGSYVDDLLIPQMKELAGDYDVDGIWIDGECWGTDTDYCPKALDAFLAETGVDLREHPPVKPGMPYYNEYRDFCREAFRKYLRHYVNEMRKAYPDFQIASNWAFTDHMPEAVCADVAYLSGDYSPQDSFNTARYCGRIIEAQDMPWDLMAWNFRHDFTTGRSCPKEPEQIKQEAAAVLSLGGGFQNYITQFKDGTPRMNQIRLMKDVAEFCRAREPWCHKGRMVPQAVIFNSKHDHYLNTSRIFLNQEYDALRGWTQLLCETQQSVEIRSEHNLLDAEPGRYPFVVISDIKTELDAESAEKLLAYAKEGGSLVISGAKALEALIAAGAPFTMGHGYQEKDAFFTTDHEIWANCGGGCHSVEAAGGEVLAWASGHDSGVEKPVFPAAVLCPFGRGKLLAIGFQMGDCYYGGSSGAARRLLRTAESKMYQPIAQVSGSMYCDVSLLQKNGKYLLQLVNTAGGHGDANRRTIDEIPPIGPLKISVALPAAPKRVVLRPEGKELIGEYRDGRFETVLLRLPLYEILEIEE